MILYLVWIFFGRIFASECEENVGLSVPENSVVVTSSCLESGPWPHKTACHVKCDDGYSILLDDGTVPQKENRWPFICRNGIWKSNIQSFTCKKITCPDPLLMKKAVYNSHRQHPTTRYENV